MRNRVLKLSLTTEMTFSGALSVETTFLTEVLCILSALL